MNIKKSDGSFQEYSSEKVRNGICAAYAGIDEPCDSAIVERIVGNLHLYDGMTSQEIRRQVEDSLMESNKKVAKAYIRMHDHREDSVKELKKKNDFIQNYIIAQNAATGSEIDANANVATKNIVTMMQELYKTNTANLNRYILHERIKSLYSKKLADQYYYDLDNHLIYKHDATNLGPYCVSISLFPFVTEGLKPLGGETVAPTDLNSFCGGFVNLVFAISSQFAGACATGSLFLFMDWYLRKDYGENYLDRLGEVVENTAKKRTLEQVIENRFQQIVYSLNTPAGNRGYQTVFWNISYYDRYYFEGIFGDFKFPDGTAPRYETMNWLQKKFMTWFNEERRRAVLTFPVETVALLTEGDDVKDKEWADFICDMYSRGHMPFIYLSESADSLASCCRLRNSLKINDDGLNHTTHQYSMGGASIETGSKSVMTINLNRNIQNFVNALKESDPDKEFTLDEKLDAIKKGIWDLTERVHKYQTAYNSILKDYCNARMLPAYDAGYITLNRQYLTIGVNGLTDAAEFMGIATNDNPDYKKFVNAILKTMNECNAKDKTKETMFNTEFVPGESLSDKNYRWDKEDGYYVSPKHVMYSSYFYNPEDTSLTVFDKLKLHGKDYTQFLDGGSAAHIRMSEILTKEQYRMMLKAAVRYGTSYWVLNCPETICNDCGYIDKHYHEDGVCPKCGSRNTTLGERIIGYMIRVSSYSNARQKEYGMRAFTKLGEDNG